MATLRDKLDYPIAFLIILASATIICTTIARLAAPTIDYRTVYACPEIDPAQPNCKVPPWHAQATRPGREIDR
jgi:hypothetical protein